MKGYLWKNTYGAAAGKYLIPGGFSEGGEMPQDTAQREVLEETGVMVNDTIANVLDTIQCRVIPFDNEWNTGISLPLSEVIEKDTVFPIQKYDWDLLKLKIQEYIEKILKET